MKITRNFVYKIAKDWRHESGWVVHDNQGKLIYYRESNATANHPIRN